MPQMNDFEHIARRQGGLNKHLTAGQMSMLAIGGAIGTGLFLGSAYAIQMAGPSVLLSYLIGGVIALLLMGSGGNDLRAPDARLVRRLRRILSWPAVRFSGALFLLVLRGAGGGHRSYRHRHVHAVLVPGDAGGRGCCCSRRR